MHQDVLRAKWKHFRSEVNYQWKHLTSDELDQVDGKRDNLIFLLERHYGYAHTRAQKEVDLVLSEFEEKLRRAS